MPDHPDDGLSIALSRIAAEKQARTGFLDLGQLGLTEPPEELFDLEHLRSLNWGNWWFDEQGEEHDTESDLAPNHVTDAFARLHALTWLTHLWLSGTVMSDLAPLSGLAALQSLDFTNTQVSDLSPLSGLSALQSLDCSQTPVVDLGPLSRLAALQLLHCADTPVVDLGPLSGLSALQSLYCYNTQVSDLGPLSGLAALESLYCFNTPVVDLGPLSGLASLQSLRCSRTPVVDLGPLSGLASLQSLDCSQTPVVDLGPLSSLASLQSLRCSHTPVVDLGPLSGLASLQLLYCSSTQVSELPDALIWLDSFQNLHLYNTRITDIPAEVLSSNHSHNCLDKVRAHLRDLETGSERLPDVKALVLGNGRIGKTQICRRLRGEDFEPNADSTHGINVIPAVMPMPEWATDARLHLWDFGGQDLYHGTHALFMRTRSLFLLVWTPQSENALTHEYRGMTFRNHPLAYWLEYVRHLSGVNSPMLIVQNMCDQQEEESLRPPVEDKSILDFPFRKVLHYSAANDRGRGTLDDALQQAVSWLWERTGQARIGIGRMAVKRRLEALRDEDAPLPVEARKYRTLTQEYFRRLCEEAGGVSRPEMLLDYLHQAGVVFYHEGLFDDRIVLDQAWAMEAVYAVFHREKCYKPLRLLRGRFNRTLLESLVWQGYGVGEQELFLSLMQSCGICFVHREVDKEKEYIAPDLLPSREEVATEIEGMWDEHATGGELAVVLPFLHPGVMRGIISRFGREAGISAVYWKYGVCLYETTTRSHALIEQRLSESPNTWSGRIAVATRGGQAFELLDRLREWIEEEIRRSGCRDWTIEESADSPQPAHARKIDRERLSQPAPPEPAMKFTPPPSESITYCVSYAWNDESKAVVDRLCEAAKAENKEILRDLTGLGLGESIARFMKRLGAGDRVFVVLSDKYLKSPYCMTELLEVWRNCKSDLELFRRRVRVFRLDDAKMMTPLERARCAKYWKEQFTELDQLVREHGADLLGEADFNRYKLMQDFAHRVGDVLALIADTVQPGDFEQLKEYGFGDAIPSAPSP